MRALMTATVPSMIGQFNRNNIKLLLELGYQVDVATNFDNQTVWSKEKVDELKRDLEHQQVGIYQIDFARSATNISDHKKAYSQMKTLLNQNQYQLVHTHTPISSALTRWAFKHSKIRNTCKMIYTAHGFHFFHGAPILNWLLYYPIEKLGSYITDTLITINLGDYQLAKKKMKAKHICYVPGIGIDVDRFANTQINREEKRTQLGLTQGNVALLSIGELNKNKNHEVIIRAIAALKNTNVHYFIAGIGDLEATLLSLAKELGIANQVHLLGFRRDIDELCKAVDVFCFPSYREGLSVSLMEAMSAGLPCIVSQIRGNTDLIQDGIGGYLVKPADVGGFTDAIKTLVGSEKKRQTCGESNLERIVAFDVTVVDNMMKTIYRGD